MPGGEGPKPAGESLPGPCTETDSACPWLLVPPCHSQTGLWVLPTWRGGAGGHAPAGASSPLVTGLEPSPSCCWRKPGDTRGPSGGPASQDWTSPLGAGFPVKCKFTFIHFIPPPSGFIIWRIVLLSPPRKTCPRKGALAVQVHRKIQTNPCVLVDS